MITSWRIRWAALAAIAIAAILLLWRMRGGSVLPVQARLLNKSELNAAEIKYGRGVGRDPNVEYQRNVVIVENGPQVIRSAGADGFTWTIDTRAGRDLSVGKIAFVTGHCVGRILKLSREGSNLTMILAPVQLTEIFKKLNFSLNQPIDVTQAIPAPVPQIPDLKWPVEGEDAIAPDWAIARGISSAANEVALPYTPSLQPVAYQFPIAPGIPQRLDLSFKTKELKLADGPSVQLAHEASGVRLIAQAQLRLKQPQLEFVMDIDHGKMLRARVILHNAAGLRLAFDSAVSDAFAGNVKWHTSADGLEFPLATNVPLAINLRQDIWVETAFSARQSVYNTAADYDLNADVGFTFENGTFNFIGPKGLTLRNSIWNAMSGVSVGASGLVLTHALTITGGLGIWQFSTGPSFSIGNSLGAAMGASEGIVQCRNATVSVNLRAGVGWTIPPIVAKFVNFFLRAINVKEIPDHDGLYSPWTPLFVHYDRTDATICGPPVTGTDGATAGSGGGGSEPIGTGHEPGSSPSGGSPGNAGGGNGLSGGPNSGSNSGGVGPQNGSAGSSGNIPSGASMTFSTEKKKKPQ